MCVFHPGSSASIILNGTDIGYIGKVHPNVVKDDVYVMEINLDLLENFHAKSLEYKEISKYPNICSISCGLLLFNTSLLVIFFLL